MNAATDLKFPFSIEPVDPLLNTQLLRDFKGEKDGFVQVGRRKYLFPNVFAKHAERLYNFQARTSDVWICTHPRSGTTLTQEMVWLLVNNFDYERGQRVNLERRSPFFEICAYMNEKTKAQFLYEQRDHPDRIEILNEMYAPGYEYMPHLPSPRVIKTHFPFSLMPSSVVRVQSRIIYVARNPKDVAVSYYYLCRKARSIDYVMDFPLFWDYFDRGLTTYAPYTEHVKEGWEHRHDPNVLFLFYEEMIKDLPSTILNVSSFLNKSISEEDLKRLVEHLDIKNFRYNASVNADEYVDLGIANPGEKPFIREGKSTMNGWPKEYTPEIAERLEAWMQKFLADTTLTFPN